MTKTEKAQNHDKTIPRLTQQLTRFKEKHGAEIAMENHVGSLATWTFTRTLSWIQAVARTTVMHCADGYRYTMPTCMLTIPDNWKLCGSTTDGKCGCKCDNGERHQRETRQTFKHWEQLIDSNDRLPKEGKTQLWSLPVTPTEKIAQAVAVGQPDKKYIIDSFAGAESWRLAMQHHGYIYTPVDARNRMAKTRTKTRQPATVADAVPPTIVQYFSSTDPTITVSVVTLQ